MPDPGEATIDLACDAALAWRLLSDPRLASEWVLGVADAEVLQLDEPQRPVQVRFTGMPSAASLEYTMGYRYDEGARHLSWHTVGEADRALDGEAWIEATGERTCRLHYSLKARASRSLPAWALLPVKVTV